MQKKFVIILISVIITSFLLLTIIILTENENQPKLVEIQNSKSLFKIISPSSAISIDTSARLITYAKAEFELKPEFSEIYKKIGFIDEKSNTAVIYPTFTEAAYAVNGFYEYYNSKCDESCLTVQIQENYEGEYASSRAGHRTFQILGYDQLNDIDIDKNPEILKQFDTIILLHNEYVTKREFDAIIAHPNVIYLYPNSLFALIDTNYLENTITLIRGHGYPTSEIDNGFDWKFDNTHPYEYDTLCENWEFDEIDNGFMLNCYPEYIIFENQKLLETIKGLTLPNK